MACFIVSRELSIVSIHPFYILCHELATPPPPVAAP